MLFSFDKKWKFLLILLFFWGFYGFFGYEITIVTLLACILGKNSQNSDYFI
tara:strand:+ start:890 stop:1042 length:153 start_codon:yes stop_codon:yes gene_type:complete